MAKSYEREIRHVARENGDQQVRITDHAAVKERMALFGRRRRGRRRDKFKWRSFLCALLKGNQGRDTSDIVGSPPLLSLPVASLGVPFSLVVPGRPPSPLPLPRGTQRCKLDPGRRCRRRRRRAGGRARPPRQPGRPEYLQLYTRHSLSRNGIRQDAAQLFEEEEDGEEGVRLRGGLPPFVPSPLFARCSVMWWFHSHSWALTLISFPSACNP